jgi:UDP-glucose:(heptosyl)LPS alpha-1,3-glucosyltransferase
VDIGLVFIGCHRRGGVERCVYEAARHFGRSHAVTVYSGEFEQHGLEYVSKRLIPVSGVPRTVRSAAFARAARKALEGNRHEHIVSFGVGDVGADVLWVNSVHAAWLERRDVFVGDRLRSSYVRRYLPRHQVILGMEQRYFTRAKNALTIAVSEQVAEDLDRLYAVPRHRSVIVHNGFDPDEFSPAHCSKRRAQVRTELGIPIDAIVLLLVANELTRKGLPVLLDAVADVDDQRLHVLLVGRTHPSPYTGRVNRLGLSRRFHYGGSRSDMGHVHAASDIFVLPTKYEAFSLAVVEALASGLPVITTDVPGARDLIVDGVNGRLQRDPVNPSELSALLQAALDGDRYRSWARAAASSVHDHTWASQLDRALEAIAGHPR